jgi:hypothetical protein
MRLVMVIFPQGSACPASARIFYEGLLVQLLGRHLLSNQMLLGFARDFPPVNCSEMHAMRAVHTRPLASLLVR